MAMHPAGRQSRALPSLVPTLICHHMLRALCRLLTLVAVLAMPLGMAAAPAAAPHHSAAATMPMPHCPVQRDSGIGFGQCTMACSAALPAVDAVPAGPITIVCAPEDARLVQRFHGLHPDTVTPPPKRS